MTARGLFVLFSLFLFLGRGAAAQTGAGEIKNILETRDLSAPSQRAEAAKAVARWERERKTAAERELRRRGRAARRILNDGTIMEVSHLDEGTGEPVFMITHNANAAISTGANRLRTLRGLTGAGVIVGVWDGGTARASHQEYGGRVVVRDNGSVIDHATHVAGTIAASGIDLSARGMATGASVDSYDWNSDTSEMISRGRSSPGQLDKLLLSNHSYGYIRGWYWDGTRYVWGGGAGNTSSSIETNFGRYGGITQSVDSIASDAPYYLMFWSAGNERNNNPMAGSTVSIGGNLVSYNPTFHPPGDGVYRNGYDTLADTAVGKNILTIGAVNDAVTGGSRDIAKATFTGFTSWGPTDDGRIKPDLVANGASLYSTTSGSNTSYGWSSGTSMSSPNAAGTAALLVQHYGNLFPGQVMRASTLKGLLIHTADDLGRPGPDYQYGWGLINGEVAHNQISEHAANPDRLGIVEDLVVAGEAGQIYSFRWDGVSPIKATLCWTDKPGNIVSGSDSRTRHLVNDLNVKIIDPAGAEFFPFVMPFVGTWTTASMALNATTGVNNTDNVEQILISSPQRAGIYQIIVSHTGTLDGGSQSYSLLVSGAGLLQAAPTISQISDLEGEEDQPIGPVAFTVQSPIMAASQLLVWAEYSNADLIAEVSVAGEGEDRSLFITPKRDANGWATITVFVTDGVDTSQTSFVATFSAINDPPVIAATIDSLVVTGGGSADFGFFVTDVDTPLDEVAVDIRFQGDDISLEGGLLVDKWAAGEFSVNLLIRSGVAGGGVVIIEADDGVNKTVAEVGILAVNTSPSFSQWIQQFEEEGGAGFDAGFAGDTDEDGIPNAAEYFLGLDPLSADGVGTFFHEVSEGRVALEYVRRVNVIGVEGVVKWNTDLTQAGGWTSQGVSETLLWRDGGLERRRAEVIWPSGMPQIFMRLEVSAE